QEHKDYNSYNNSVYTRNLDPNLFFKGLNRAGEYDNFYSDASKITSQASQYPFYYVDRRKKVVEPKPGTFSYYLENPNSSYPQETVMEMVYTEMVTKGYCDVFLWAKDGKEETRHFDLK